VTISSLEDTVLRWYGHVERMEEILRKIKKE
jgi:hypothetical protein